MDPCLSCVIRAWAGYTHRPLSSSFLGLPYRILNINRKKELLRGLWVPSNIVHHSAQSGHEPARETLDQKPSAIL